MGRLNEEDEVEEQVNSLIPQVKRLDESMKEDKSNET